MRRRLLTERQTPARILRQTPFLLALGSPFGSAFPAVLSAPTALWEERGKTYSHFFIGFLDYIPRGIPCQALFKNFLKFIFPEGELIFSKRYDTLNASF